MTRHWIAIPIALVSLTALVPTSASAQILKVAANLDGTQSVPPPGIVTGAHGTVEITGDVQTANLTVTNGDIRGQLRRVTQ
jgi:hypothetical protein